MLSFSVWACLSFFPFFFRNPPPPPFPLSLWSWLLSNFGSIQPHRSMPSTTLKSWCSRDTNHFFLSFQFVVFSLWLLAGFHFRSAAIELYCLFFRFLARSYYISKLICQCTHWLKFFRRSQYRMYCLLRMTRKFVLNPFRLSVFLLYSFSYALYVYLRTMK